MTGKQEYRMGVGASSILMIFVVLSLTTLGMLAFASGRADLTLTERRQAQVEAYYNAAARAERIVAAIDEALLSVRRDPEACAARVKALADWAIDVSDDWVISFTVPVSQSQRIEVALRAAEADAASRYTVERHRLVNIAEWKPAEVSYTAVEDKERGIN
ncbi:MAG: hypothetical protein FWF69_01720 [Firmicutes bacterium]|nr:hypothetical protein [Bacillota bacterium]